MIFVIYQVKEVFVEFKQEFLKLCRRLLLVALIPTALIIGLTLTEKSVKLDQVFMQVTIGTKNAE